MTHAAQTLPGIERIRQRFLDMIVDRQSAIASHIVTAWDAPAGSPNVVEHVNSARDILHTIAGSAGSLGFSELGEAARAAELTIISQAESGKGPISTEIVDAVSEFVAQCQTLLDQSR